jgi:hypothetical protein
MRSHGTCAAGRTNARPAESLRLNLKRLLLRQSLYCFYAHARTMGRAVARTSHIPSRVRNLKFENAIEFVLFFVERNVQADFPCARKPSLRIKNKPHESNIELAVFRSHPLPQRSRL